MVLALVCRTGIVLDAYAPLRVGNPGEPHLVPQDPELAEAAIASVRHCVFRPGMSSGQAMACWVACPVRFDR